MKRIEAISKIMSGVVNEVVITSTGMISREVCHIKDRPRNFYMMGSMGTAISIGLGIAYARPDIDVIVISGDGAMLMSLGTLALHNWLREYKNVKNVKHYILDNGCHATTGGQKTCSAEAYFEAFGDLTTVIKVSGEKGDAPRIPFRPKEIKERLRNALNNK